MLAGVMGCGDAEPPDRGDESSAAGQAPPTTAYPDLNAFLASEERIAASTAPVVFIGIDGADWEFIDPLLSRGELPNIRRLKEEGSHGRLRSIPCFVSPPAWATMLTGALPERTGVYTFGEWDPVTREFTNVNAENVRVPAVWDVASYCGKKVGVFNVPMTFPPHSINGAMVTGMMTPYDMTEPARAAPISAQYPNPLADETAPRSYSAVRRSATDDSLNVFLWSLYDTVDDGVREYDRVGLTVVSKLEPEGGKPRASSYWFDVNDFSPWIQIRSLKDGAVETAWRKMAIVRTPNGGYDTRISPSFSAIESAYTYPDSLADALASRFGYYIPSAFVGADLVSAFARDASSSAAFLYNQGPWDLFLYVFTQSDNIHHLTGFSPQAEDVYRIIDEFIGRIMASIEGRGTLVIASDHGFGEYTYGVDLNRFLEEKKLLSWRGPEDIDYDRSLVFHNIWHLYFNDSLITRESLRERGFDIGETDDPVEFLDDYLRQEAIVSADGSLSISPWYRRYANDARQPAPDLGVGGTEDDTVIDFLGFSQRHPTTFRRLEGAERFWHKRDGVYMAWGKGIRRGADAGTKDIQDIAPTLLYLLGIPVAEDMDGKLIHGIVESKVRATRPLYAVPDFSLIPRSIASGAGKETLEKKLRSLGYMQ